MPIGQENIPKFIQDSEILDESDLQKLATYPMLPQADEIEAFSKEPEVSSILEFFSDNPDGMQEELHKLAKNYLSDNDTDRAWKALMQV